MKWSELRALLTKCIEQDSDLILPMNPSLFDEKGVYRVREILRHMPNLKAYKNSQVECPQAPYTLFVEPTNHCNLKCTFCPQKDQKRSLGFLDMGLYRDLTYEAAKDWCS